MKHIVYDMGVLPSPHIDCINLYWDQNINCISQHYHYKDINNSNSSQHICSATCLCFHWLLQMVPKSSNRHITVYSNIDRNKAKGLKSEFGWGIFPCSWFLIWLFQCRSSHQANFAGLMGPSYKEQSHQSPVLIQIPWVRFLLSLCSEFRHFSSAQYPGKLVQVLPRPSVTLLVSV